MRSMAVHTQRTERTICRGAGSLNVSGRATNARHEENRSLGFSSESVWNGHSFQEVCPMTTTDNNNSSGAGMLKLGRYAPGKNTQKGLPRSLFRYVLDDSGRHQPFLALLAVVVCLIEFVPLE